MKRSTALFNSLVLSLVLVPVTTNAEAPPSSEADRVINYYYSNAAIPVLMEFKLCSGVHDEGPNQHNCMEELDANAIEAGSEVHIWMKFLVPRDATPSILTQLNHDGITRRTFNRDLSGAIRYRTWHTARFDNTGSWEIVVLNEGTDEVVRLASESITVR